MIGLREDDLGSDGSTPPPKRVQPEASRVFREGGYLEDTLLLEHRPQQEEMALAVSAAFDGDHSLLFEAGTGVGKSLAYLVPGILSAIGSGRQMIVSTHTISLQEQIEHQDLPMCRRLFRETPDLGSYAEFRSAILVGKANYLCTTRLASALAGKQELFSNAESAELQRIADWAATTSTGLRHELTPRPSDEVWEHVNADSSGCSRKHCDCKRCFYQLARARIRDAHVIIVNHSLLFALINAGSVGESGGHRGVLFPDDFVVIDEAHTMPDVATEHFGLRISNYGLERLLKHLYNPRTRKGLLMRFGESYAQQLVIDALEASGHFFGFIAEKLLCAQPIARIRTEGAAEPWLNPPLLALMKAMEELATRLNEGPIRDDILEQRARLKTYQQGINRWLAVADTEQVYWAESEGKRRKTIALRTAPLDISAHLRETLFDRGVAVVCTSATLTLAGQIDIFQRRIGAEGARTGIVLSPFDYEKRMRVFLVTDMPLPSKDEARLEIKVLSEWIRFCTLSTSGGSLVLFTSYHDLLKVAEELAEPCAQAKRPLLIQSPSRSRTALVREMRHAGNAILLGTDSFWTGVDVPGDALSQVIITRLPFEPPNHPIAAARSEHIIDAGGNPFNELTLPDALMKFRQGVGRLIRKASDRGIITILDSRIVSKTYGRLFLETLPQTEHSRINLRNREALFNPFI